MKDVRVPGRMTAGEGEAWKCGRADADRAHNYADTYREPFALEAARVPVLFADSEELSYAYRDGYAVRAQDLNDGSADE